MENATIITPEKLNAVATELMPVFKAANKDNAKPPYEWDGTSTCMLHAAFRVLHLLGIPQSVSQDKDTQKYTSFTIGDQTYTL